MKYFIAGGTSHTGMAVVKRLTTYINAKNITCLVRPTSNFTDLHKLGVQIHKGDVTKPESYKNEINSKIIYIDMTHPKYYHISLETVMQSGVKRGYFITTTGIFSKYNNCSEIYKVNEAKIKESGITYTILRPTMIYGHLKDKNMNKLIKFLNQYPVFPLFGNGESLMQPVYVDDLAEGIVAAVVNKNSEMQEYNLAGLSVISFRDLVDVILEELNRKVFKVNISIEVGIAMAKMANYLPRFPITKEQILRLQEDKIFDISKAVNDLGYSPRNFQKGIRQEIQEMRRAGVICS